MTKRLRDGLVFQRIHQGGCRLFIGIKRNELVECGNACTGAEFTGVYARSHGSMKGQQRPEPVAGRATDASGSDDLPAGERLPAGASSRSGDTPTADAGAPAAAPIPAQLAALARTDSVRTAGVALGVGLVLRLAFAVGLALVSRKARQRLRRAF